MEKERQFWQLDLTPSAQELRAFNTRQGRVFKLQGHALCRGQRTRSFPRVDAQDTVHPTSKTCGTRTQVLGAQMPAHIDDVCLGTDTQEDHLFLLGE